MRGTLYQYNYFQGRYAETGIPFQIPGRFGGGTTSFTLSGDPVTGTGWIDGIVNYPGDRNMNMTSGPFNLMPGDTQEVVFAQMVFGGENGVDRLGAVALLKYHSKNIQLIYDGCWCLPFRNIPPIASAYEGDREIILYWGSDIDNVKQVEYENTIYKFQGYNLYQIPNKNSGISEGSKIATYDIIDGIDIIYDDELNIETNRIITKIKHSGTDSGIERYIRINKNYLENEPLNNGTKYYYLVETYYYNPDPVFSPRTMVSHSEVVSAMPQSPNPGIRYPCEFGDSLHVTHTSGYGSADVDVMIIDPSKLTGCEYEITFHESAGQLLWNLEDQTLDELKFTDQTNITGTDEYYIVDGFRIIITQDPDAPLTNDDVFTFTSPGVIEDDELAKNDVDKINVFPNPYYGGHGNELNQYHNYVMFNHLPKRAIFRIFNLAGHLVRTLEKDDDTQFYLWDLQNENRLLAPSGLYIIYIEMPDLQKVKVLKLAIIQREVIPDHF